MSEGRVIAFDLGDRRIGVAVSDPLGMLATGRDTIARDGESYPWKLLLAAIEVDEVVQVVVGDPLNVDGTVGERSRMARSFAEEIGRRAGLPVDLEDERYTSEEAEQTLAETGRSARRRKRGEVDRAAAALILQGWLDDRAGNRGRS